MFQHLLLIPVTIVTDPEDNKLPGSYHVSQQVRFNIFIISNHLIPKIFRGGKYV